MGHRPPRLGVVHTPTTAAKAVKLAETAEEAGVEWFGVVDSPVIYGALYPIIQRVLDRTERIRVGPFVTNPVTCHASVHAATYRTLEELHPGRAFLAISTGDSAVHAIGLKPASPDAVAETVDAVRAAAGDGVTIVTAVGGPRSAARVSPRNDAVVLGTGLDIGALETLASSLPDDRVGRWGYAVCNLAGEGDDERALAEQVRSSVVSFSRHAVGTDPARRGVPAELVEPLRELYSRYDFSSHSRGDANGRLLREFPAVERYLFDRFAVVGTPERAAVRLDDVAAAARLDTVVLSTIVPDPVTHVRRMGRLVAALGAGARS